MDSLGWWISLLFLVGSFAYIIFFRPKLEKKHAELVFDNRVLALIDGLYLSGLEFGCTAFEMRSYADRLLKQAHALPGNRFLLSHTITDPDRPNVNGWTFRSHTGTHSDHISFAILCIIEYAKEHDNQPLIAQCEQFLLEARHMEAHY